MSIAPWVAGAASLLIGPGLVTLSERTIASPLTGSVTWVRTWIVLTVSVVVAVLCPVGWVRFGATPMWLAWCWACCLGISLTLTDLRCHRLPFPLVTALAAGVLVALIAAAATNDRWGQLAFACGTGVVVLALAVVVQAAFPDHTGGGDTALYGALALYLGWFGLEGLLRGLLMASGLTAVVALVLAACSRRMNSRFPAGPPLLAGALASMLVV